MFWCFFLPPAKKCSAGVSDDFSAPRCHLRFSGWRVAELFVAEKEILSVLVGYGSELVGSIVLLRLLIVGWICKTHLWNIRLL